jgi:hypothetical protein
MYNADPVSSACFWLLCILAAVSFLVTCTFAMWSTVVMAASGIGRRVLAQTAFYLCNRILVSSCVQCCGRTSPHQRHARVDLAIPLLLLLLLMLPSTSLITTQHVYLTF